MRTFNEQLRVAGVSSYDEWLKTKTTDFRLLLLTQGSYLGANPNQIMHYWAIFSMCANGLIEVRIMRAIGFGPLKTLRFKDPKDPTHPLNGTNMVLFLAKESVEQEIADAENYARDLWNKYQERLAALEKKCDLEHRNPTSNEMEGLNKPSRPHDIFSYLMRNDIKILKEKKGNR